MNKPKINVISFPDKFIEGKILFNKGEIYNAHIAWEKIWKNGDADVRKNIKGFIQLTGALLNNSYGKKRSADYLLKKSIKCLKDADRLPQDVDISLIINQIENFILIIKDGISCGKISPIKI